MVSKMKTTVNLCFVMDCTASMGPWMRAAKESIQTLIYEARAQHPDAVFQVGFVGYRDYGSQTQHVIVDFTDPEEVVRQIAPLRAEGGGDDAEDVAWGLWHANELLWNTPTVGMIYHIADAPAHGKIFTQGNVSDHYPDGDPKHLDPRLMIKVWSHFGYHYTFVRITDFTDTMVEHFHNAYTEGGTFRVMDLTHEGSRGFLDGMRVSMNETLTQCISAQDPVEE